MKLERTKINLNSIEQDNKSTFELNYELKILEVLKYSDGSNEFLPHKSRKKSLEQEELSLGEKGEFKVFELGKITYNFAKRIDPLIKATYKGKDIIFWKNPEETFGFGIIISLLIYFPKISIILLSLCLVFAKGYLINFVQTSMRKKDISKRLFPPEENLNFLHQIMELYCNFFENFSQLLKEDDKTKLITLVEIICKCGFVFFVLSLALSLETLVLIAIWLALFFTSSTGRRAIQAFWPQLLQINKNVDSILSLVSKSSVGRVLKSSSPKKTEILKEFYIYEYQRWWVGKEWVGTHYSDEGREVVMYARKDPPLGWKWVGPWKIEKGTNTDPDGFEYTNDLIKLSYTSAKYLKTIRRRRWTRVCKKEEYLGEHIIIEKLLGLESSVKDPKAEFLNALISSSEQQTILDFPKSVSLSPTQIFVKEGKSEF